MGCCASKWDEDEGFQKPILNRDIFSLIQSDDLWGIKAYIDQVQDVPFVGIYKQDDSKMFDFAFEERKSWK